MDPPFLLPNESFVSTVYQRAPQKNEIEHGIVFAICARDEKTWIDLSSFCLAFKFIVYALWFL
jgi:hypothetical protein